jgi:hypothetical protein
MVIKTPDGPRIIVKNPPDGIAEFDLGAIGQGAVSLIKSGLGALGTVLGGGGDAGGSGDVDVGDIDVEIDGDKNTLTIVINR